MKNIDLWKYNSRINEVGFLATLGMALAAPPQSGSAVESPYLLDSVNMVILLLLGTALSAFGSYMHRFSATPLGRNQDTGPSALVSLCGAASLCTAALYAFDIAFLNGDIMGTPMHNAGPDTAAEKGIFSGIYAIVALAGLLVVYTQFKPTKDECYTQSPYGSLRASSQSQQGPQQQASPSLNNTGPQG